MAAIDVLKPVKAFSIPWSAAVPPPSPVKGHPLRWLGLHGRGTATGDATG